MDKTDDAVRVPEWTRFCKRDWRSTWFTDVFGTLFSRTYTQA